MRPHRGYQSAAITKHTDPQRRDDARQLATLVHADPCRGVRRDWLEEQFCAPWQAGGWHAERFKYALFYAYGMRWIEFCGWTYVVVPAPLPVTSDGAEVMSCPRTPATNGQKTSGHSPGSKNHSAPHPATTPQVMHQSTIA